MSAQGERVLGLQVDIDARLTDLWTIVWGSGLDAELEDDDLRAQLAGALRIAYSQGYTDALREDAQGRRGELARTHGYRHD